MHANLIKLKPHRLQYENAVDIFLENREALALGAIVTDVLFPKIYLHFSQNYKSIQSSLNHAFDFILSHSIFNYM